MKTDFNVLVNLQPIYKTPIAVSEKNGQYLAIAIKMAISTPYNTYFFYTEHREGLLVLGSYLNILRFLWQNILLYLVKPLCI